MPETVRPALHVAAAPWARRSGPRRFAGLALLLAGCAPGVTRGPAPPEPEAPVEAAEAEPPALPPAPADTPAAAQPEIEDTAAIPALDFVRVCAGGDVMLGSNLDTLWAGAARARLGRPVPAFPEPDGLLAPLAPLVADADVVLLNIEAAIGDGDAPSKCRPGSTTCYAFRQPPAVAGALARLAPRAAVVGNVANNHAMDAGADGFHSTARHLRAAQVAVTGVDTLPTLVLLGPRPDTVAVLGFSTFRAGPDARDLDAVRRHVARAFARYRRVVVSVHIGAEGRDAQRTPRQTETFLGEDRGNPVAFARAAVESGAALVVGHGPHVLRALERRGDALIFYSLGNLVTYGPFNMTEPLNRGAVACATVDAAGRVDRARVHSTIQRPPGRVEPDASHRGAELIDALSGLDFPESPARVDADGTVRWRSH